MGIISSNYEIGCSIGEGNHTLAEKWRSQANEAYAALVDLVRKERFEKGEVIFVGSPFGRATKTGEETVQRLNKELGFEVQIDETNRRGIARV